jgi:type 1 glutamine amidotransferase
MIDADNRDVWALAFSPAGKIKVGVVVGGHGGGKEFFALFDGHDDISYKPVHLANESEIFEDITHWPYDVIVLYNLSWKISERRRENFKQLMDRGLGVVTLHHAFSSYQDWPEFSKIVGGRSFLSPTRIDGKTLRTGEKGGNRYTIRVADKEHPVTKGVADFELVDETYFNYYVEPDSVPLLTTQAQGSDKVVGWAHTYRKGRSVYLQAGHGPTIFQPKTDANQQYRRLLGQAIRWVNQNASAKSP